MRTSAKATACWCGETRTRTWREGTWSSTILGSARYLLVRCAQCGTVRAGHEVSVEYDTTSTYEKLGPRHHASLRTLAVYTSGRSVIELGSSNGEVLKLLKSSLGASSVYGIDFNARAVEAARSQGLPVELRELADVQGRFDLLIAMHVIEHVPDLPALFSQIRRVVPGGRLYFSTPNLAAFNARRALNTWGALNPFEHVWYFDAGSFRRMIKGLVPEAEVTLLKTSWVFPIRALGPVQALLPGDQLEAVITLGREDGSQTPAG
jgi:SAM-dependent methyltransferase